MKVFTVLLTLTALSSANAQSSPGILEGLVVSSESAKPLERANVSIQRTSVGDATDARGFFRIVGLEPGEHEVTIQLIGYRPIRRKIRIEASKTLRIHVKLTEEILEGSEVTVEGERIQDIRLKVSPPTFELSHKELNETPGTLEDVMRSIFSLPGVHSTSDFSNQFIVRGGGPDQNLILMDDIEIVNPYRNSGMPSLINPNVIQDVSLYAGGYPALFGDRLSSVLVVHTRDGTRRKWLSGEIGLNLATTNMVLEGKIPVFHGSWLISNRSTYNQFFAKTFLERRTGNNVALPDFKDRFIKIAVNPATAHRLQFHNTLASNNQDFLINKELGEQDTERDDFDGEDNIKTEIIGGSWNYTPSVNFQAKVYGNRYKNIGNSSFAGNFIPSVDRSLVTDGFEPPSVFAGGDSVFLFSHNQNFSLGRTSLGGWSVFEHGRHVVESGFGVDFLQNSVNGSLELSSFGQTIFDNLRSAPNWFGALGDTLDQQESYKRSYFYLQDKWGLLGGKLSVQPGLRFDYYDLIGRGYVSPRMRVSYKPDLITSFNAAGGIYRQSPGFEKLLDGGGVFDLLKFEDFRGLAAERAIHGVLGYQRWLGDQWHFAAESYYKRFDDLIAQTAERVERPVAVYLFGPTSDPLSYVIERRTEFRKTSTPVNDVSGNAYGLDLRFEKRTIGPSDAWYGWASYSLGRSMRKQTFDDLTVSYPYDFDRRHSLDVVLNFRIDSDFHEDQYLFLGLTWRYGTGFPYTPALSVEPLVAEIIDPNDPDNVIPTIFREPVIGSARFIPNFGGPENINSLRYPDYHRLDIRLTFLAKLFDRNLQIYLDVINVYNRKNVLFFRTITNTVINPDLPVALRFPQIRAAEEPVYMYPFLPSIGMKLAF